MKKILYFVFGFIFIFALTACDGELTLPSGVTLPTDITIDDLTSEVTTNDATTDLPTSGLTTEIPTSTDTQTTTVPTTQEPTTQEPTTQEPTTIFEVTISFDSQGGLAISPMTVSEVGQLTNMPVAVREGYRFDGWFEDAEATTAFSNTSMPADDLTLYAKWTINQYTISFEENDGSDVADITQDYQSLVTPPTSPTKPGYSFLGWFEDMGISLAYTFDTMPAEDITLYAGWTINQYDIIYVTYDGDEDFVVTADYMAQITPPTDPVKTGYTFDGWYSDAELTSLYSFDTMPLDGITLYPKWVINQYTISFEENDGSDVADITQDYQSLVTPPTSPTKPGYSFLGWFEDMGISLAYTFDTMPAEDITLYAGWTINQYDIIYVTYDGDEDFVVTADYMAQITPPTDPVKTGYTFDGWYSDAELTSLYSFDTMPLDGITLYPKWVINQYTISFEENGGSLVDDLTADYMADISQPLDPNKDGFTFMGWYTDSKFTSIFVFDTMPLNGLTLYAKWQGSPASISFMIDDLYVETLNAFTGDLLSLPTPELMGRTFVNWYLEEDFQTPVTWNIMPAGDQVLYGEWSMNTYTITYDSNGGSLVSPQFYLYEENLIAPADPSKTDYVFAGWYEDTSLLNAFDFTTMPAENLTLYAKWIDASDLTSIFNVSQEDTGTMVTVQGTVYATLRTGLYGFLIFDSTGYIAIDGAHDGLEIGDTVEVAGTLVKDDGAAHIYSVTSIQVIADAGDVLPIQTLDLGDLYDLTNLDVYKAYQSQGILITMDENYYLMDPNTLVPIMIMSDSVEDTLELAGGLGNQISLTFAYFMPYGQPMASIIDYTITPLTIEEKALTIKNAMMANHNLIFYPGDFLPLNEFPLLGEYLSYTIAVEDEVYFDTTSHTFLSTSEDVIIPFDITLSYMMQTYTFTIDVTLKALDISSIAEVIDDPSQNYHTIEALVVSKGEIDILLKDASGYLYAVNPGFLNVGDLVRLVVRNDGDYPMPYLDFYDGDLMVKTIISTGNDLAMASTYFTGQDLLALNQNDLHIYGEYIEIRGFIQEGHNEKESGFFIHTEDFDLPIMALGHSGFEKLFEYVGLEVYIKGFIYRDFDGRLMLHFEGIRDDIIIPDYTDQERVEVLTYMFNYYFGDQTFDAFQSFEMAPYHPVIGCDITWAFTDPNFAYFDQETYQFLPAMIDQEFSMDITITCGSASTSFVYTSSVNAIDVMPLSDINDHLYEDVFVQGLVIFQSHEYIYLMDDLGHILYVQIENPDVYVGDQVLLYGYLTQQYNTIYLNSAYDGAMVQEIISRSNPVSIPVIQTDIESILAMDNVAEFNSQIYVEIQGRIQVYNDYPYIQTPEGMIVLMTPYEQVRYELYEYEGENVILRGYIYANNQYISTFGQRHWTMNFVGEPGDIEILNLSNQEKFDFLEVEILERYQISIENLQAMDFSIPDFYFNDVDISYTPLDDTLNIFDFTVGRMQSIEAVTEETVVTIQVDMTIGSDTDTFTFTVTITPTMIVNVTPIDSLLADGLSYESIQGQVIVTSYVDENLYALLVDDGSGQIIVLIDKSLYESDTAYYHKYINDEIIVGGLVTNTNNQLIMEAQDIQTQQSNSELTHVFLERSVSDVLLEDMTDPDYMATPYLLSGHVTMVPSNFGDAFYLTQGEDRVRIFVPEAYWSSLRNYMGYNIQIRVFAYGNDQDGIPAFMYTNRSYLGDPAIELADYTDEEILEMMMQSILDDHNAYNPMRVEDDYVWYPSIDYVLMNHYPQTTITYEVISGNEYVTTFNDYFLTLYAPMDVEIITQATITLNSSTIDFTFSTYLNGYTISDLADLFDPTPSTQEIAIEAIVLYSGFNSHYFEIEGKVYRLNLFMYGGLEKGGQVIIIGQKSVINGVADYTYNVKVIDQYTMGTITLTPQLTTIEDLYTTDYDINPLHQQIHTIYGRLSYDPYLDLFTLTDNGYTVYVEMLQEGWEYIDYLSPYIDEYVYIDVLLPREIIRNTYIKVDTYGGSNSVELQNYTPQEDVALIKERLGALGTLDVNGGDLISDYIPSESPLHPYTHISFSLVNSADALLYDEVYGVFNAVSAQMTTQILATIHYYNPMDESTFTDTIVIDINIHPRPQTTITDVLYGIMYETYQIEGYVVAFGPDQTNDAYMIVFDGSEEIRVDLNSGNIFNGDQLTLALYDQVVIIGKRLPHQLTYLSPKLDDVTIINVISSNNTINDTPTTVSLEDLLDQTITDMTLFQDYISITGTFHWFGDPVEPNFYLESERLTYNGSIYRIVVDYPEGFTDIEALKALDGQTLTITGYTRGYESLRVPLGWHMIYESHEVLAE